MGFWLLSTQTVIGANYDAVTGSRAKSRDDAAAICNLLPCSRRRTGVINAMLGGSWSDAIICDFYRSGWAMRAVEPVYPCMHACMGIPLALL